MRPYPVSILTKPLHFSPNIHPIAPSYSRNILTKTTDQAAIEQGRLAPYPRYIPTKATRQSYTIRVRDDENSRNILTKIAHKQTARRAIAEQKHLFHLTKHTQLAPRKTQTRPPSSQKQQLLHFAMRAAYASERCPASHKQQVLHPIKSKKNTKKQRTTLVCLRKTPTTEIHKNTHHRTKPAPLNQKEQALPCFIFPFTASEGREQALILPPASCWCRRFARPRSPQDAPPSCQSPREPQP